VIDVYIAELAGTLRGPRRVKADLLTEARDSLVDAAEAYERGGLSPAAAQRRAVGEFGQIRQIAPGYQTELALAQGRRTALLVFTIVSVQYLSAEAAWRYLASRTWTQAPEPAYAFFADVVDVFGVVVIIGALLAALAVGRGVRHFGARRWIPRAIGVFALAVYGFFALASAVLVAYGPMGLDLLTSAMGPLLVLGAWVVPLWMAASARRCLAQAKVITTLQESGCHRAVRAPTLEELC
jgi:hypothetical protein